MNLPDKKVFLRHLASTLMRFMSMVLILCAFVRIFMGISYINTFASLKNMRAVTEDLIVPTAVGSILIPIGGGIQFVCAMLCAINCDEPEGAKKCLIWGFIALAFTLASNLFQFFTGYGVSWVAHTTGEVVPVLYIAVCVLRKRISRY